MHTLADVGYWHETDLPVDLATCALESTTDVQCNALVFGNQKFITGTGPGRTC
jgi:hypothetical protein